MIKIYDKETIQLLTDSLKDMLCREYNWIQMRIDKDDYLTIKSFTEEAVYISCCQIEIGGGCSSDYSKTFIANLDLIKELAENQPTYEVEVTVGAMIGDTMVTDTYTDVFKGYNNDKLRDKMYSLKYIKNYISHKLIQK